jgi:hypothetical protein
LGLSRFSFATGKFTNFDSNDGLQSNQFEAIPGSAGTCVKEKDGTLYFGGDNGLKGVLTKKISIIH